MAAMLIREHPTKILDGDTTYVVRICGEERIDRTWEAWLEFHPTDISQPVLRTDQETSQPKCPGAVALVDVIAYKERGSNLSETQLHSLFSPRHRRSGGIAINDGAGGDCLCCKTKMDSSWIFAICEDNFGARLKNNH